MSSRKDVAKLAGVSPTSVSYYVNENGYVSVDAGRRIQNAIDELAYTPNQIARSLKVKDSKQFVYFCNEIRNPFYAELVYKATKVAQKEGYLIMFTSVIDDDEAIKKICSYQISGVFASNSKIKLERINAIAKKNIPVVMLRDIEWENIDKRVTQIKVDYSYIMNDIVYHLNDNNYKNIIFISSSITSEIENIDEKTKNFIKANNNNKNSVIYNISSTKDAREYIVTNYTQTNCPDAFVCANDAVAIGVIRGLTEIKINVTNVAVVGFDNTLSSQFTLPTLTTVEIDSENIGAISIELLMKKLKNEVVDDYVISPKLIIRESSMNRK